MVSGYKSAAEWDAKSIKQNVIDQQISDKLKRNLPLNLHEQLYTQRRPRGKSSASSITTTTAEGEVQEVRYLEGPARENLEKSSDASPVFLWRAYSLSGGRPYKMWMPTNGVTTETLFVPSRALAEGLQMRQSIFDIDVDELIRMTGQHLVWDDTIADELQSWTSSPLFGLTHMVLRHLMGQENCHWICLNRLDAERLGKWSVNQQNIESHSTLVKFYHAPHLCDAIEIFTYSWDEDRKAALHYRKVTHEYLTQGIVAIPENYILKHVALGDLVKNGLFDLIPELKIQTGEVPAGLYTILRYLRDKLYRKATDCTVNVLNIAERLALLHTRIESSEDGGENRPHLWVFMGYLSLRLRGENDELFRERIRKLGYTRADLDAGLHQSYERIPSNLPERMSLMNLMRNVQAVVGGEPIHDTVIVTQLSNNPNSPEFLSRDDAYYDKGKFRLHATDKQKQGYELTSKVCDLDCRCNLSRKKTASEIKAEKRKALEAEQERNKKIKLEQQEDEPELTAEAVLEQQTTPERLEQHGQKEISQQENDPDALDNGKDSEESSLRECVVADTEIEAVSL